MTAQTIYDEFVDHGICVDLAGDIRAVLSAHDGRPLSPSGTCNPFDVNADGSVVGEGAAAVVLKRLDDARRDGDRVYAVVRGIGSASSGGVDSLVPSTAVTPGASMD